MFHASKGRPCICAPVGQAAYFILIDKFAASDEIMMKLAMVVPHIK